MCSSQSWISPFCFVLSLILCVHATTWREDQTGPPVGGHLLVKTGERKPLISTEFGQVSGAKVTDGNETFLLHFITMEPNSLFLPVLLHQDMVFYVHTGSGRVSYKDDSSKLETTGLRRGDVFRLESGSVFFIQSDLDPERQKLRIYAIFGDVWEDPRDQTPFEPYSSIRDLVLGFEEKVLQQTFNVPQEVIEEMRSGPRPEAITHGLAQTKKKSGTFEFRFIEDVLGAGSPYSIFSTRNKDKKKSNLYNLFHEKKDFENCNGWSTTVDKKKYSLLTDSKYGLFMVNLTRGAMMGPHWNPKATEIAIVLHGKGMVRVVCPSLVNAGCKNARFAVEEGDVFVVPRFHPMAQMAFDNDTFVFVGFSTSVKNNHPQYLAGKASVLRTLDKHIMATSFGVNDTTFDKIVNPQGESVILACVSCAEVEFRVMREEIEREREAERQREEEEERRRRRAEEERRHQGEAKKREEEEAEKREAEAARKREEEEMRKREQEAARKREEEEMRKREQEAARKRREEEEAQKRREEEEREREEQEREHQGEEQSRREQEEAAQQRREEEERQREKQQKEEEAAQKKREQRAREEEQARMAEKEREAAARREEEAARRREEAAQRKEAEAQRRQQEAGQEGRGEGQREGGPGGGEQPPAAQREEEAARQQEETGQKQEQQQEGGGTGWGRRILKETS